MRARETDIMKKVELFESSSLFPKTLNSRVKRPDWLRDPARILVKTAQLILIVQLYFCFSVPRLRGYIAGKDQLIRISSLLPLSG